MKWLTGPKSSDEGSTSPTRLDRLVGAARAASHDRLSAETRDRVINQALRQSTEDEALPALFTPTRRLVVAGVLPLLLAVALVIGIGPQNGSIVPSGSTSVEVSKKGDQVLFTIANGKRVHRVVRSSEPNRFDGASGVSVTDGAYSEGLSDNQDLVFYRID